MGLFGPALLLVRVSPHAWLQERVPGSRHSSLGPTSGHSCSTAIPDPFDIGSITCAHSFMFLSACVFVLQWQAQLSIIPQQFQLSV